MRQSIVLLTFIAALAPHHASAAKPGENFYGVWQWKSNGPGSDSTKTFTGPVEACLEFVKGVNQTQSRKGVLTGVAKKATWKNDNEYTCKWDHPSSDGKSTTHDTSSAISASFVCPPNATRVSINMPGTTALAKELRCNCNMGTTGCVSPSPPAYDTSGRCVSQNSPKAGIGLSPGQVGIVPPNLGPLEQAFLQSKYDSVRKAAFANAKDCTFLPSEIKEVVNIGPLCGFRDGDFFAADREAGFTKSNPRPDNLTWHHDLTTVGKMMLVDSTPHQKCSHTGSAAVWAKMYGLPEFPSSYPTSLPKLYAAGTALSAIFDTDDNAPDAGDDEGDDDDDDEFFE